MPKLCPSCGQRTDKKPRSLNQNSYLWGIVYQMIADETGHSTEEIHSALKSLFLPHTSVFLGDKATEVAKSTKELTTSEMEEYLMRCRVFAGETLGINIPLPNDPYIV